VVGVEADPSAYLALHRRFKKQVKRGKIHLLNYAVSDSAGADIEFYIHNVYQGISGTQPRPEPGGITCRNVKTIDWSIYVLHGCPRYMKVDVEGSEGAFLSSMMGAKETPEFVSIEAYKFSPIEILGELGYTRFRLIDQTAPFQLPDQELEGRNVGNYEFTHASGPFGLDVFRNNNWESLPQLATTWKNCTSANAHTWYDCHAWKPSNSVPQ